jgi:hypothetical protein
MSEQEQFYPHPSRKLAEPRTRLGREARPLVTTLTLYLARRYQGMTCAFHRLVASRTAGATATGGEAS